jgi:hypothetical protein
VTATNQIQQHNTPAPDANRIREAVQASQAFASGLLDQLRRDGLDEPGVTRDTYGPGEQRAHVTCAKLAETMGLTIERDPAANLYMTQPGLDAGEKRIIVGSHLDSVPHGGNFDGAAGVVAGLVALQALQRLGVRKVSGFRCPTSAAVRHLARCRRAAWRLGELTPAALWPST